MGRVNERDSRKKATQRADSKSNLMGKFTQSVRRMAQDFQDPGTPGGITKEEAMKTSLKLTRAKLKLENSYDLARAALVTLVTEYGDSKELNCFSRYRPLKIMIKKVMKLHTDRSLVEISVKHEKQEPINVYVLRACEDLEKSQVKPSGKGDEEERLREEKERLEDMTSVQIEEDNTEQIKSLCRMIKRYSVLRNLVKGLAEEYRAAKYYPFIPRYVLLKDMIRTVSDNSEVREVFHEPTKST